jgi:hypothetical protein
MSDPRSEARRSSRTLTHIRRPISSLIDRFSSVLPKSKSVTIAWAHRPRRTRLGSSGFMLTSSSDRVITASGGRGCAVSYLKRGFNVAAASRYPTLVAITSSTT